MLHVAKKKKKRERERRLNWGYLFPPLFKYGKSGFFKMENKLQITPSILLETLGKLSGEHLSRPRDKNHKSSV
jgi:hypothetical protein